MDKPYQHHAREQSIIDAIERVSAWSSGKRRKLLLVHVEPERLGHPLVLLRSDTAALPAEEWADVVACGAFEPNGIWVLGIHYVAAPGGCQNCALANWTGDAVTGCGWSWCAENPKAKPIRLWSWPNRYLDRVTKEGKRLPNGHIETDDLHYQCSRYQEAE